MTAQPMMPLVYEMVEETTAQTTVVDVLVGSVSIVGVLGLFAVLLGLAMAGGLILLRQRGANPVAGGASTTRLGIDTSGR